jgi:hypothetical protein
MPSSFVTPPGIVKVAHIWRPFGMPFGLIWYGDLAFEISGSDTAANNPLTGLWRLGVLSTPTINDSMGKIPMLSGKVGTGSTTRVSGDTEPSWPHSIVEPEVRLDLSLRCLNQVRGTLAAGLL